VITDVAILVAAKKLSLERWPISPMSTKLASGSAKFEKNIGIDSLNK
jgi:hypothetical protein